MIMNMNSFFAAHSDLDVDAPLYRIMLKKHLEQLLRTNTLYFEKLLCGTTHGKYHQSFGKAQEKM